MSAIIFVNPFFIACLRDVMSLVFSSFVGHQQHLVIHSEDQVFKGHEADDGAVDLVGRMVRRGKKKP